MVGGLGDGAAGCADSGVHPVTPYEQDGITLHCGDCREVLATLPDGLVDAVFEQQRTLF
jgi:hypothetical protein